MLLHKIVPFRNFVRHFNKENFSKTTAIFLNKSEGAPLMISSYNRRGFRLNNQVFVIGSLALFPRSVLSWKVHNAEQINEDSLSLFQLIEPKIDILVIGTGDQGTQLSPNTLLYMRKKGLTLEVLPTIQACSTYNFLVNEGRFVAAAMIPPSQYSVSDEDLYSSLQKGGRYTEEEISKMELKDY